MDEIKSRICENYQSKKEECEEKKFPEQVSSPNTPLTTVHRSVQFHPSLPPIYSHSLLFRRSSPHPTVHDLTPLLSSSFRQTSILNKVIFETLNINLAVISIRVASF
ncbi:hypothetical protein GQ457_08G013140 [Hibiscus cannabinus]